MNRLEVLRAAYREGVEATDEAREKPRPPEEARGIFSEAGRRRKLFTEEVKVEESRARGRRKSDSA